MKPFHRNLAGTLADRAQSATAGAIEPPILSMNRQNQEERRPPLPIRLLRFDGMEDYVGVVMKVAAKAGSFSCDSQLVDPLNTSSHSGFLATFPQMINFRSFAIRVHRVSPSFARNAFRAVFPKKSFFSLSVVEPKVTEYANAPVI